MRSLTSYIRKSSRVLALALVTSCGSSHPAAPDGDFSFLAGSFSPDAVRAGDSTALPVSSAFLRGFSQPVAFGLEGPSGFSAIFTQCSTVLTQQFFGPPPGAWCNATIRVDSAVAPGQHPLVFVATSSGSPAKRIIVPLLVLPPRPLPQTFSVVASTKTVTVARGDSVDVVFALSPRPSGAADVTFTVLGSYVGIALVWIPSAVVVAANDSVRVRIKVNQSGVVGAHSYFFQARLPGMPVVTLILAVNVVAN